MDDEQSCMLTDAVRQAYSAVAERPKEKHAFPVGRSFAESIGYSVELLDNLPVVCAEAFTGVSNVSVFADIPAGSMVLDLGCGAGLDVLVAAKRTGPGGRVIGVDFSEPMLARARGAAAEAKLLNIEFQAADATRLPISDGAIDVALVNGIFNLNPNRDEIFRELARVVRPGGAVYVAELILKETQTTPVSQTAENWST